jgi:hypothetical protein
VLRKVLAHYGSEHAVDAVLTEFGRVQA